MFKEYCEVSKEPQHAQQLENQYMRVYNVVIQPKTQCQYHRHSQDTFYIAMNKVSCKNIPYNESYGTEGVSNHTEGETFYRNNLNKELIHKVENVCDAPTHFVGMEIKVGNIFIPCYETIKNNPKLHLALENKRVRTYTINLASSETVDNLSLRFIGVLAFQTDSEVELNTKLRQKWTQSFKKGQVLFLDDTLYSIRNTKNSNIIMYIVQIKTQKPEEKIIEEPIKSNEINVSSKKGVQFYRKFALVLLNQFKEVQLHAIGEAVQNSITVASILQKENSATISKIESFTTQLDNNSKKIKMIISLSRID